jgi:dihydrodipicolinate synthase/N-acetylneuraminate lyase
MYDRFMILLLIALLAVPSVSLHAESKKRTYPSYLNGAIAPLRTPFIGKKGVVGDLADMARVTDRFCQTGVAAVSPVSGVGQWEKLPTRKKKDLITSCVFSSKKRKPVLAGAGSTKSVDEAIELGRFAEHAGADGVVVVAPDTRGKGGQPDQNVLMDYYLDVCQAIVVPIIVFDPDAQFQPKTFGELVDQCSNVVAIGYNQTKDMSKFKELALAVKGRAAIWVGSDAHALEAMKNGATGLFSDGVNDHPDKSQEFVKAALEKKWDLASKLYSEMAASKSPKP